LAPAFREKHEKEGETSLSWLILETIDPFLDNGQALDLELGMALDLATIAWNECVDEDYSVSGSCSLFNAVLDFYPMRDIIELMKIRKRCFYTLDYRHITKTRVFPR
jgi:hypothetical protein